MAASVSGLANRLTEPGEALLKAMELAKQLAAFPQLCMRSDRLAAYEQWSMCQSDAIANEYHRGMEVVASGEAASGPERFAEGDGRHGSFNNP